MKIYGAPLFRSACALLTAILGVSPAVSDCFIRIDDVGIGSDYDMTPDGSTIVFTADFDPFGLNGDNNYEVFTVNPDGSGLTQITETTSSGAVATRLSRPAITDDGDLIVFETRGDLVGSNADRSREIFAVNADGSGLQQLTDSPTGSFEPEMPDIAGDGTLVTYIYDGEVYILDMDTSVASALTTDGLDLHDPRFTADQQQIYFTGRADTLLPGQNTDSGRELYIIDTDGTNLMQLTDLPDGGADVAQISADKSKIAFESETTVTGMNDDGRSEAFVQDFDGTNLMQLSENSDGNSGAKHPSITSDGSLIVFTSSSNLLTDGLLGDQAVYLIESDLEGLRRLTDFSPTVNTPKISENGRYIIFRDHADFMIADLEAPRLPELDDLQSPPNISTGFIDFTVDDIQSPAGDITISASSSDQGIVENGAITLAGDAEERAIDMLPAVSATGTTDIIVTATDSDSHICRQTFALEITSAASQRPGSPTTDLPIVQSPATGDDTSSREDLLGDDSGGGLLNIGILVLLTMLVFRPKSDTPRTQPALKRRISRKHPNA